MNQINFRINEDDKAILQAYASERGISLAELAKESVLSLIKEIRIDFACELLKKGKIGKKRALTLSGLSFTEFTLELGKRNITEPVSEEFFDKGFEIAKEIDLSLFKKEKID